MKSSRDSNRAWDLSAGYLRSSDGLHPLRYRTSNAARNKLLDHNISCQQMAQLEKILSEGRTIDGFILRSNKICLSTKRRYEALHKASFRFIHLVQAEAEESTYASVRMKLDSLLESEAAFNLLDCLTTIDDLGEGFQ